MPIQTISGSSIWKDFVDNWVIAYGPPLDSIAENGSQFTFMFFQSIWKLRNVHNSLTITYHLWKNGQFERSNLIILSVLEAYIADHPQDWDLYTKALTYVYNFQPHTYTWPSPLSRPPWPLAAQTKPSEKLLPFAFCEMWNGSLVDVLQKAEKVLRRAQENYKITYDKRLRSDNRGIERYDYVHLRIERREEK